MLSKSLDGFLSPYGGNLYSRCLKARFWAGFRSWHRGDGLQLCLLLLAWFLQFMILSVM